MYMLFRVKLRGRQCDQCDIDHIAVMSKGLLGFIEMIYVK